MQNEREIISKWFYEYSQDVFNFLVYYTGTTDVEDLVQDVFIKAAKGLEGYKKHANPKTWLFSIARNLAIDNARKKETKFHRTAIPLHEHTQDQQTTPSPEQILLENEEKRELYQAINQQKKKYRDVLILRGIQGLSISETAQILGCKETAVRTNYHRAIKALQSEQVWRVSDER
jgi:RNA polymerase sigma-70 factor, ECF subfamily